MGLIVRNVNFTGNFRGTFPQVPPPPPPSPAPSDVYGAYTVLDLPGTGTNNSNNNVFLDSSSNNFSITRFGNTTQGSFSPFSTQPGYWSNYFDGSGDYLTAPSNSLFTLGSSGNFTIEFWVYLNGVPASNTMLVTTFTDFNAPAGYFNKWGLTLQGVNVRWYDDVGNIGIDSSSSLSINSWNHIAVVRNDSTITMYINGTSVGAQTIRQSYTSQSGLIIGYAPGGANYFNGYISNLRIVKGTAIYTTNFTPSTTPLTAVSGTSLLTCQSNRFIDNSSNSFAITRNGNTSVSAFGPYAPASSYNASTMGGSMYFDGNGDYLTAPANSAFALGTGPFTIECWVYPLAYPAQYACIASNRPYASGDLGTWGLNYNSGAGLSFDQFGGAGSQFVSASSGLQLNTWTHIAVVRTSTAANDTRIYLNGVLNGQGTISANFNVSSNSLISGWSVDPNAGFYTGYISDLHIIKGTAKYSGNFTPPTAPVSSTANTSLLLRGTNGAIVDAATKFNVETLGDSKVSTTISASGSMYFDGVGDYLEIPNNIAFTFGTQDYTIETWFYIAGNSSIDVSNNRAATLCSAYNATNPVNGYALIIDGNSSTTGTGINFQQRVGDNYSFVSYTGSIAHNVWHHVAVARSGTLTRLFLNGIIVGTATFPNQNVTATTNSFKIGALRHFSPSYDLYFNGYINNLRITKGIARYTANFTPPTRS